MVILWTDSRCPAAVKVAPSSRVKRTVTIDIPTATDTSKVGATLKITLIWIDPRRPILQNGLDLIVKALDGTERHGNAGFRPISTDLITLSKLCGPTCPPGRPKSRSAPSRLPGFHNRMRMHGASVETTEEAALKARQREISQRVFGLLREPLSSFH